MADRYPRESVWLTDRRLHVKAAKYSDYTEVPIDVLRQALESHGLHIVTSADKKVLDACAAMKLCDDDPDADPMEPQEQGEDCYIYTDDQEAIARAELTRRNSTKA